MDEHERAKKDIEKLKSVISEFKEAGLGKKFPEPLDWAERYLSDAQHFFDKKDYFTAFGAANYAYGIIDGLLIAEGKK